MPANTTTGKSKSNTEPSLPKIKLARMTEIPPIPQAIVVGKKDFSAIKNLSLIKNHVVLTDYLRMDHTKTHIKHTNPNAIVP